MSHSPQATCFVTLPARSATLHSGLPHSGRSDRGKHKGGCMVTRIVGLRFRKGLAKFSRVYLQITVCQERFLFVSSRRMESCLLAVEWCSGLRSSKGIHRQSAYLVNLLHTTVYRYERNSTIESPHGRKIYFLCVLLYIFNLLFSNKYT